MWRGPPPREPRWAGGGATEEACVGGTGEEREKHRLRAHPQLREVGNPPLIGTHGDAVGATIGIPRADGRMREACEVRPWSPRTVQRCRQGLHHACSCKAISSPRRPVHPGLIRRQTLQPRRSTAAHPAHAVGPGTSCAPRRRVPQVTATDDAARCNTSNSSYRTYQKPSFAKHANSAQQRLWKFSHEPNARRPHRCLDFPRC